MGKKNLKERQMALYRRYRETGDRRAHAELVETFRGLVYKLSAAMRQSGIPRDDLVSEGLLGVCEAIENYDPARGDLAGLAYHAVKRHLDVLSRDMSRPVSAARSRPERRLRWHLARTISEYEAVGVGEAVATELAAHDLGVSPEHAVCAMAMRSAAPIHGSAEEESGLQIIDEGPAVEDQLDLTRVRVVLAEAMAGLDDGERYVLAQRLRDG